MVFLKVARWCHTGCKYVGIHWKILSTFCMFGIFPDKHWGEVQLRKVLQASFQQCCACSESSVCTLVRAASGARLPASAACQLCALQAVTAPLWAWGWWQFLLWGLLQEWDERCGSRHSLPIANTQGPLAIAVPLTAPPLLMFSQLPS